MSSQQNPQQTTEDSALTSPSVYTKPRAPHKTVEAIDDFSHEEENNIEYTNDTDFVNQNFGLKDRGWKKSKKDVIKLQQDLKYGQYLHVPKAQRSIFTNDVARRKRKNVLFFLSIFVLLVILAILYLFVPRYF